MVGFFHFAPLALLPILVGYFMRRTWQRPTASRMIAATGVGGASALVGATQIHMCLEGVPLAQWIIPGASGAAAMLFIGHPALRRALSLTSVLIAISLSFHFTSVVHDGVHTGNPRATPDRAAPVSEWHTFLTGLYRRGA